jgi:hypothetical protein
MVSQTYPQLFHRASQPFEGGWEQKYPQDIVSTRVEQHNISGVWILQVKFFCGNFPKKINRLKREKSPFARMQLQVKHEVLKHKNQRAFSVKNG